MMSVVRMPHGEGLPLPAYETPGSAGMDLRAAVSIHLPPGVRMKVPTGLKIAVPAGYVGLVCGRSGLASRYGVTVIPSPGVVDSDYRGELIVTLINLGHEGQDYERGERIAQLLIVPVFQTEWREVESLDETTRGSGGFGSTGAS